MQIEQATAQMTRHEWQISAINGSNGNSQNHSFLPLISCVCVDISLCVDVCLVFIPRMSTLQQQKTRTIIKKHHTQPSDSESKANRLHSWHCFINNTPLMTTLIANVMTFIVLNILYYNRCIHISVSIVIRAHHYAHPRFGFTYVNVCILLWPLYSIRCTANVAM